MTLHFLWFNNFWHNPAEFFYDPHFGKRRFISLCSNFNLSINFDLSKIWHHTLTKKISQYTEDEWIVIDKNGFEKIRVHFDNTKLFLINNNQTKLSILDNPHNKGISQRDSFTLHTQITQISPILYSLFPYYHLLSIQMQTIYNVYTIYFFQFKRWYDRGFDSDERIVSRSIRFHIVESQSERDSNYNLQVHRFPGETASHIYDACTNSVFGRGQVKHFILQC